MSDFRDMAENHAIFEILKKNIKLIEHKHIKDQFEAYDSEILNI